MRKNVQTMVARIVRLVGDTSNDAKPRALEFLNDSQEHIQTEHSWSFLNNISATITLIADQDTYSTVTGMYNINKVYYQDTDNSVAVLLRPVSDEDWLKYYEGSSSGNPTVFRLISEGTNYQNQIQIGRPPSTTHISHYGADLYLEQYDKLTELTTPSQYSDLPYDFTKALEFLAAGLMCQSQGDFPQAQGFLTTYAMIIKKLIFKDVNRYGEQFDLKPDEGPLPWRGRSLTGYQRVR